MVARPKKAAPAVTKPDFAALLAGAKLPERTVLTCLRGDLKAEHEQLEDELERLEKDDVGSLAGNGGTELAERIKALEAEMRANTYPIQLRALPAPKFREFKAKFPVRIEDGEPNQLDQTWGFDMEAGHEPLIRVSIVDPELDDEGWEQLKDSLTERQLDDLFWASLGLNRGGIDVPLSRAASRLMGITGSDSKPPTD